jgi:pimeloyl-ACP methyl ester carboxylesterase
MGRHDYDTPAPLAASYAAAIQGTHRLFWFENSAHFPFFEEPTAFYAAMREVRTLAAATGQ